MCVVERNLLSLVGRDGGSIDTIANSGDASSNNELSSCTAVRGNTGDLNNDTNDHDEGTEENRLAATELVTEQKDEDGAQEATNSVDGDNKAFVIAVIFDLGKGCFESWGGNDTTHDTLVVTKEQKVGNRNDGNQDLEHPSGLAPVGGNTRIVILDAWHSGGISWREVLGISSGERVHL